MGGPTQDHPISWRVAVPPQGQVGESGSDPCFVADHDEWAVQSAEMAAPTQSRHPAKNTYLVMCCGVRLLCSPALTICPPRPSVRAHDVHETPDSQTRYWVTQ